MAKWRKWLLGILTVVMVLIVGLLTYAYVGQGATPADVWDEIAYQVGGKGRLQPAPAPPPAATRDGRWQQDLTYLKTELPRLHANPFRFYSRPQWEGQVATLSQSVGYLTDADLNVGVMALVAELGDGHTSVSIRDHLATLPIKLAWFGP